MIVGEDPFNGAVGPHYGPDQTVVSSPVGFPALIRVGVHLLEIFIRVLHRSSVETRNAIRVTIALGAATENPEPHWKLPRRRPRSPQVALFLHRYTAVTRRIALLSAVNCERFLTLSPQNETRP